MSLRLLGASSAFDRRPIFTPNAKGLDGPVFSDEGFLVNDDAAAEHSTPRYNVCGVFDVLDAKAKVIDKDRLLMS